jgi:5-methylcytosine-specific restriction endonuclease McrA
MQMGPLASKGKLSPLSPGRFSLQVTVDQETHDLMRQAQVLLGHALPSGDIGELIKRAMRELVERLEKRKCAATSPPRPRRGEARDRQVPAEIRRTVWHRNGGQCTFVSDAGKRCDARKPLEYDHVIPVARGGETTVANLRLRCRVHNQHAAECTFGAEFMRGKRGQARRGAAETKERAGPGVPGPVALAGLDSEPPEMASPAPVC